MIPYPLHESTRERLHPEYVDFHDKHMSDIPPSPGQWDPAIRDQISPISLAGRPAVHVESIRDVTISEEVGATILLPEESQQRGLLPTLVFYHGGGFALGGPRSEIGELTRICRDVPCIVVSVKYRLAPDNPFPAAVNDAVIALQWVYTDGPATLGVDPDGIAVGGVSAGANLAAVVALKAPTLETPVPLRMQLLLFPVIDNTTNSVWCWSKNWHAPGLGPSKMAWYRGLYIRNRSDGKLWEASPHLAPSSLIRRVAKASIVVAEVDILNGEGVNYAKLLKKNGVPVTFKEYKGAPHMLMAMGAVMESARMLVQDTISTLKEAFMTADK